MWFPRVPKLGNSSEGDRAFAGTDELLLLGAGAARDGDRAQARFYLEWALRDDPTIAQFAEAWYWLSRIAETPEERRNCLARVIGAEPLHAEARRDLAILDGRLREDEIVDPDAPLAPLTPSGAVASQDVRRYHCPNCGSAMLFDPAQQGVVCQFCGHHETTPSQGDAPAEAASPGPVAEQDWDVAIHTARGHRWVLPGARMLTCEACGATQTLPEGRTSALCAFCGSAQVIVEPAREDLIAPEGIAPFVFDASEAWRRLHRHLARRGSWRDDGAEQTLATPRPIYLPFWTFDIEGEVRWRGQVARRDGREHREGGEYVFYDDLLVPAGGSVAADGLAALTFDTRALAAYSPDLLAGWPAELYRLPVVEASLRAREEALHRAKGRLHATAEEELHDLTLSSVGLAVVSYKLILLPVWVATYRDGDGEQRHLVISGQAGADQGEAPRGPLGRLRAWMMGDEGGHA